MFRKDASTRRRGLPGSARQVDQSTSEGVKLVCLRGIDFGEKRLEINICNSAAVHIPEDLDKMLSVLLLVVPGKPGQEGGNFGWAERCITEDSIVCRYSG